MRLALCCRIKRRSNSQSQPSFKLVMQCLTHRSRHGPYALAAYTCFGLGAYSSTRTTLSELVPWIPISLCISLLLTVFFPPKIRELCAAPENDEILMEEGRFLGFHRSPVQPGSVQSDGHIQHREQSPMTTRWVRNSEHDVAYTLGRPASRYSSRSLHDSTIVLDDFEDEPYRGECMVRPQEAENYTSTPPQDMPEASLPCQHAAGAEAESYPRSTSSDSLFEGPEISEEIPLL